MRAHWFAQDIRHMAQRRAAELLSVPIPRRFKKGDWRSEPGNPLTPRDLCA
jgi:hypothetical protein